MKSNSGIFMTGGKLISDQLAVGDSASINVNQKSSSKELINKIDVLLIALENEKANLNNFETLKQASDTIKTEANKKSPDKNSMLTLLSLISSSVPAVSGITNMIKAIQEVLE
jgi:hypothetical protein